MDIASLVAFRIAFGGILLWEMGRYWYYGWVRSIFIEAPFHFTYYGLDWLRPLPGQWMYLVFSLLAISALCICLGLAYRIVTPLFFFGMSYIFLIDQAYYLNHLYLICLVAALLVFLPANRALAIDVLLRPQQRSDTTPAWTVWLLRLQVGIAYFYGGLAKINPDWLRGEPLRDWLADERSYPVIGRFFDQEWAIYLFSYGGLIFDLAIVPLLLWRKTRWPAVAAAIFFHLSNSRMFEIGVFPWLMIATTPIFLPPDWLRRVLSGFTRKPVEADGTAPPLTLDRRRKAILAGLVVYTCFQLMMPFRHFLYPGNVMWTEEATRFSWHMRLWRKDGDARFFLTDPVTGRKRQVNVGAPLNRRQSSKMFSNPDMILQYAQLLAERARELGMGEVIIQADIQIKMNGRLPAPFIDPNVDLAKQPRRLGHHPWVNPTPGPPPSTN